jgi:hypothetical protein
MTEPEPDWLTSGKGERPRRRWSFTADAPLVCLELARESGEVLAADTSGGLYLLDRRGQIAALSRDREARAAYELPNGVPKLAENVHGLRSRLRLG